MQKEKQYQRTRFAVEVLREASEEFRQQVDPSGKGKARHRLTIEVDGAQWQHDSVEEFLADYRRSSGYGYYDETVGDDCLCLHNFEDSVLVQVTAPDRTQIEAVFGVFEKHLAASRLPAPPKPAPRKPTIFIGHGGSPLWRDLKDHLQDKQGYTVEAYETGARAGHAIRDILKELLSKSSFAILVMTGEDKTADGERRARQNVVHEAGLFQGRLGFSRAIVLLEEDVEEFSNIHGIEQIRFAPGNIKETYGEVLGTLRREFSESED